MTTGTYDFGKTVAIFGNVSLTGGAANGESITIEESGDAFKKEGGAGGHSDRVRDRSISLTITLRVAQTSSTNEKLSALYIADKATSKGIVPFFLKDLLGTTLITAAECWIEKSTPCVLGNDIAAREWTLSTGTNYEFFVGGNR